MLQNACTMLRSSFMVGVQSNIWTSLIYNDDNPLKRKEDREGGKKEFDTFLTSMIVSCHFSVKYFPSLSSNSSNLWHLKVFILVVLFQWPAIYPSCFIL